MEYVSGPSLHELLTAEPNGLGPQKAAFFLDGIARGLSYLHERGIVHRDLKPANIFYDDGYVKIGDYGLSKHISVSAHSGQTVSVGTVHYMAPEIGSGSYSKAIDVYALGVMLYEMITGKLPFTGSSMGEVLMRHLSEAPDISGVAEPFASVIAKALAKNPADRYQDANEMVAAVKASAGMSDSIASFDPTTLTSIPRAMPVADGEPTVTAGAKLPPLPDLDARGVKKEEGIAAKFQKKARKFEKKAEKFARKMEKKANKFARKMDGTERIAQQVDQALHKMHDGSSDESPRRHAAQVTVPSASKRIPQIFALLAVAVTVSLFLGVLAGRHMPQSGIAVAFCVVGASIATLLSYFKIVSRMPAHASMMNRLIYASVAAGFMIPGIAIASDIRGDFSGIIAAPLAVMLLCNWTRRIDAARRGGADGGSIFGPGVVGFLAAAIATQEPQYGLIGAGMGAMLSLVIQTAAGLWPISRLRRAYPVAAGAGGAAVAPAAPIEAGRPFAVANVNPAKMHQADAEGEAAQHRNAGDQRAAPASASVPAEAYTMLESPLPSFVDRTANAGLAFLGKLLLLLGITAAMFFNAEIPPEAARDKGMIYWSNGHLYEVSPDSNLAIPRVTTLVPILFGALFLVISRRHDGAAHFLRGFIACLLGLIAAIIALGPAADSLGVFLGSNWEELDHGDNIPFLVCTGLPLMLSMALLFWPKRRQTRQIVL